MRDRRQAGRLAILLGLALFGATACLYPGAEVPYVQTPHEVVAEMLRLASVGLVFPASIVFLIAAGFSPFLYFQF